MASGMSRLCAGLLALLLSAHASAGLSQLAVTFEPNASTFHVGDTIDVSAAGNGVKMRYYFELSRMEGEKAFFLRKTFWSSLASYQIDTTAFGMDAGEYRLRVYSREYANKRETLVKTEFFTLVQAPVPDLACADLDGMTLSRSSASPSWYVSGDDITAILNRDIGDSIDGVTSLTFSGGNVQIAVLPFALVLSDGFLTMTPYTVTATTLNGTYTCGDHKVMVDAAGTIDVTPTPTAGAPWSLRISGDLYIDGPGHALSAYGDMRKFQ